MTQTYPATAIEAANVADLPDTSSGSLVDETDERTRNRIRAEYAIVALKAYAEVTNESTGEPIEAVISDLLGDLMHLCDALVQTDSMEQGYYAIEARASDHHREELYGEQ